MRAIYYTVEGGYRQLLATTYGNYGIAPTISNKERKRLSEEMGHPLRNLFVNIDGNDYQICLKRKASVLFNNSRSSGDEPIVAERRCRNEPVSVSAEQSRVHV